MFPQPSERASLISTQCAWLNALTRTLAWSCGAAQQVIRKWCFVSTIYLDSKVHFLHLQTLEFFTLAQCLIIIMRLSHLVWCKRSLGLLRFLPRAQWHWRRRTLPQSDLWGQELSGCLGCYESPLFPLHDNYKKKIMFMSHLFVSSGTKNVSNPSSSWPSVFRMMMRYCVAPATPVHPSLTVLPRVSTTLRLDTLPTGCTSAPSKDIMTKHTHISIHWYTDTFTIPGDNQGFFFALWISVHCAPWLKWHWPLGAVDTGVPSSRPSYRV